MSKKIIFIEDEPSLQKALSMALKSEGFDVKSAFDGETGLNFVKEEKPDLVLLDLILPKMDGFAVLESIRSSEDTKNIPVIVLTNLEEVGDVQKVIALGATSYLIKANYNIEDITAKIKETLGS